MSGDTHLIHDSRIKCVSPDKFVECSIKVASIYKLSAMDEPAHYQLVGRVMAYQGYDGYLV